MLWVDVCRELGGIEPTGYVEADRVSKPFGYERHMVAGAHIDTMSDEEPWWYDE